MQLPRIIRRLSEAGALADERARNCDQRRPLPSGSPASAGNRKSSTTPPALTCHGSHGFRHSPIRLHNDSDDTHPGHPNHGYTAAATTYARPLSLCSTADPPTPGAPMSRLEGDICLVKRKLLTPLVQDLP